MAYITQTYRFHLPKKAIKSDCPQCGPQHRKTFSRYVDSETGEVLPEQYGRCDRESNCGYYLSPYMKDALGNSYANQASRTDSIPRQWYATAAKSKRNRIRPEDAAKKLVQMEGATPEQAKQVVDFIFAKTDSKPTVIHAISSDVYMQSLCHYEQNRFARLLRRHFGFDVAAELLQQFHIGTSSRWPGACIFWLIDEEGRKRGGQIKLFDKAFRTVKYTDSNGQKRSRTSWVHAALAYHYTKLQHSQPEWLVAYIEQADFAPCLFGLPQLSTVPKNKPVALVEAPKTAVLCTPYFPQFIWLAVIGRSYLNAERLAPLKGRSIVLFPDLSIDGRDYAYWKGKADNLRQQGFNVVISDYLEKLANDEDREKGYDLADYLLTHWKAYPQSWDMHSPKPAPIMVPSANKPLAEVLAKCLNLPVNRVPLYQFFTQ